MTYELQTVLETGLTLTANLMNGPSIVASAIPMTESGVLGFYTGSVPGATPAGRYTVLILQGSTIRAYGELWWNGAASVVPASAANVWAEEVEPGFSAQRLLKIVAAAVAGKTSNGPNGFSARNLSNTATQIAGLADVDGNRTSTTYGL